MRAEQALAYFKRRRDAMQLMEEDAAMKICSVKRELPDPPKKEKKNDKL